MTYIERNGHIECERCGAHMQPSIDAAECEAQGRTDDTQWYLFFHCEYCGALYSEALLVLEE